jgi:hypothetical protein
MPSGGYPDQGLEGIRGSMPGLMTHGVLMLEYSDNV